MRAVHEDAKRREIAALERVTAAGMISRLSAAN
jgi:hypothetical protein